MLLPLLMSAPEPTWLSASRLGTFGFIEHRPVKLDVSATILKSIGFERGSVFVACCGPMALFSAVVNSCMFHDDEPIFGEHLRAPLRFHFREVRRIRRRWFTGDGNWREALADGFRRSLYRLSPEARTHPQVRFNMLVNAARAATAPDMFSGVEPHSLRDERPLQPVHPEAGFPGREGEARRSLDYAPIPENLPPVGRHRQRRLF